MKVCLCQCTLTAAELILKSTEEVKTAVMAVITHLRLYYSINSTKVNAFESVVTYSKGLVKQRVVM